jgi:hypothetical protein
MVLKQPDVSREHIFPIFRVEELSLLLASVGVLLAYCSTLNMEAICSSEMSGSLRTTRHYIPEHQPQIQQINK